jgi:sugar phosphate isomerase/epimerase
VRAGIGSYAFGWAVERGAPPFDELALLDFATRHGLGVVQVADNLPVHLMDAQRFDRFVRSCRSAAVLVEVGARGLTEPHLARYLDLACAADARLLRFVVDARGYEPPVDEVAALLRNAVPSLDAAGVTLALENHDRFGAATLRALVDRVGSPRVGVCLDTANSLGAGEGLEYVSALLAPVTVNLHVKDVRIPRVPYMQGFVVEGCPLGEGRLPIPAALARVAAEGSCHSAILEAWTPPAGNDADTVAREADSAERSVETLKGYVARLVAGGIAR